MTRYCVRHGIFSASRPKKKKKTSEKNTKGSSLENKKPCRASDSKQAQTCFLLDLMALDNLNLNVLGPSEETKKGMKQ